MNIRYIGELTESLKLATFRHVGQFECHFTCKKMGLGRGTGGYVIGGERDAKGLGQEVGVTSFQLHRVSSWGTN